MNVIGVVGAGVMGRGVSQCFAQAGMKVVLVDISSNILENAKQEILRNIRFQALFKKSTNSVSMDDVIARIEFTTEYELLKDADFLVENVTEKWEIKKDVYEKIDKICKPDCVFAVNTSCISITRIGSLTQREHKIIGTHFMNPVPMKPLVEVIRGYHTSEETIKTTKKVLGIIGKECVVVNDYPGFVSNRVLMLTINEAVFLLQDQVANVDEVDKIFKLCFGHKMGPLETADLIGLDTILYSIDALYESYNDSKYRAAPLLRKMVDAGLYGMKSGQGFYKYEI